MNKPVKPYELHFRANDTLTFKTMPTYTKVMVNGVNKTRIVYTQGCWGLAGKLGIIFRSTTVEEVIAKIEKHQKIMALVNGEAA